MWINLCGRGLMAWVRCCVIEIPLKATETKTKQAVYVVTWKNIQLLSFVNRVNP